MASNPQTNIIVGQTLREIRMERGLTQTDVARSLHTSQTFVSKTELGKRGIRVTETAAYSVAFEDLSARQLFHRLKQALQDNGEWSGEPRHPRKKRSTRLERRRA